MRNIFLFEALFSRSRSRQTLGKLFSRSRSRQILGKPAGGLPNFRQTRCGHRGFYLALFLTTFSVACSFAASNPCRADELTTEEMRLIRSVEKQRIMAIGNVIGSVIAIYDENRQGGGSGVIIDPSGIALTNHHVIMGAGVSGWGGLADGKLYRWKLIGTDPGGDVSIIQMEKEHADQSDFPFTPLGDSDEVRVGDWALAMGNPFVLTEDQSPTVTLGIVSGIKRYQPGAGQNQLVYGNCIQVDSSINPGNSGGPLFNFHGRVIGINGRGSFQDRGRVNVGLGYAISSNQIKNFVPDLLATKLVEHATLDASFSDRQGKVVCSTINQDSPVAAAGLKLGDELLEFEDQPIINANQFTNLICTLPEDWPTVLKIRSGDGEIKTIHVRMLGLPYAQPPKPKGRPGSEKPTPQKQEEIKRQTAMVELLSAPPGEVRYADINKRYAQHVVADWKKNDGISIADPRVIKFVDEIKQAGESVGTQEMWLSTDGRFSINWVAGKTKRRYLFDGQNFYAGDTADQLKQLSLVEAKLNLPIVQAYSMTAAMHDVPFLDLGLMSIDGSGKAMQQNAWRLKVSDSEDDSMFVWLRMYDETGLPNPRLLKVAPEKNCDKHGGVTFSNWQSIDGVVLPLLRQFVKDLAETPTLELINQSHQVVGDVEPSLFVAPADR